MAVMVCTPNIYCFFKVSCYKLVIVVGYICRKVCGNAVCSYQNLVFFFTQSRALVPKSTVLFVGVAVFGKFCDCLINIASVSHFLFGEPNIVLDAVFLQVLFHIRNIFRQCIVYKSLLSLVQGLVLVGISVNVVKFLCPCYNVRTLIELFVKGIIFVENLHISCFKGKTEFFDLVAGIIYQKFSCYIIA